MRNGMTDNIQSEMTNEWKKQRAKHPKTRPGRWAQSYFKKKGWSVIQVDSAWFQQLSGKRAHCTSFGVFANGHVLSIWYWSVPNPCWGCKK